MKISIITVCLNAAATIDATLDSVAAQTHQDIEHIVVDGGSTDGTLALIAQRGVRVAQLVSEPDRGIYDAMNKGIRLATGDVVGTLNADDVYAGNTVLAHVDRIMTDGALDALYGDVEFFSPMNPGRASRRYSSRHFSPDRIGWGWMPAHPALFLRREIFSVHGLYKTDYRIAGDFELVARVFKGGEIKSRYLPEVLTRMRSGGISTGGWRSRILLNQEVMRACRENEIETSWFRLLSKYPMKMLELLQK